MSLEPELAELLSLEFTVWEQVADGTEDDRGNKQSAWVKQPVAVLGYIESATNRGSDGSIIDGQSEQAADYVIFMRPDAVLDRRKNRLQGPAPMTTMLQIVRPVMPVFDDENDVHHFEVFVSEAG